MLNKEQVVERVAKKAGLTKKAAAAAVSAFTEVVEEALAESNNVQLMGFGTFENAYRAARRGRNPQTGEMVHIPETNVPRFRPGSRLKNAVK